jgi:Asp-tRNA(Asn)/Glu-tRNA(Gln) amidotransferase A subunit family amidase
LEPYELSATAALALIETGELSSGDLVRSCLHRIERRDSAVRAWSFLDPDHVVAQAQELDTRPFAGSLWGLPIGVKDIIETADMPTSYNSPIYAGRRTAKDAACVAIARRNGALIMGKTDTVEFAAGGRRALTRNPHDLRHTPGASSSGSAAAVADFMVPLALGTQSAGSVIRPAAYTGVYAFKPSFGLVSAEGCKPSAPSYDTVGWFARCVDDLALVATAFRLPGFRFDARLLPAALCGLRVGLCRTPHWDCAEPAARAALAVAAERLAGEGAVIVDLDLPRPFDGLTAAHGLIMRSEGRVSLLAEYLGHGDALSPDLRALVERGAEASYEAIAAAHDRVAACRVAFDALCEPMIDVVLTPAAPGAAPEGLQATGDPIFNGLWTALHVPCVAVPAGREEGGLPVGVQFVGRRFRDDRLLAIAKAAAVIIDPAKPSAPARGISKRAQVSLPTVRGDAEGESGGNLRDHRTAGESKSGGSCLKTHRA